MSLQRSTLDPAVFGRVAVLMGGTSAEREVSLNSGANVLAALQRKGVNAFAVDGIDALIETIRSGEVDRVFNILHGGEGENGVVQGLLEAHGIPYTGPGVMSSALTMDKIRTKQVWQAEGLPTPAFVRLAPGEDVHAAATRLGLPVVVKPSAEGSSVGVSMVETDAELDEAIALAARYHGELLVEQMIIGAEFSVPVVAFDGKPTALPSIRIIPKGRWYDYHAKYIADDTQYICPGNEGADEDTIRDLAERAFKAVGLEGWSRVDFMQDAKTGQFYLIEVNTAPGMTSHSLVPKAAAVEGVDYDELCFTILASTVDNGGARP